MATGTTVTLYANGVRVADGAPTDNPDNPTALDDLAITWGRSTTVDQPEASTMTVDLMDNPGGGTFAALLHIGTPLRVTATGMTYPNPSVTVWPDPGFEAAGPNATGLVNAEVSRVTSQHHGGTRAARVAALDPSRSVTAVLAPLPFAAPNTDPDAWDAIPTTAPGQTWQVGLWVLAPLGASVAVRPVLFSGPYAGAGVPLSSPVATGVGTGAWQLLSGPVTVQVAGRWLGVQVATYPTGRTWNQAVGTWDAQTGTWDDLGSVYVDDVAVLAPAAGVPSTVLVWAGRVTDLQAVYDDSIPAPVLKVTGADFTADLANTYVGDTPWLAEALSVRFQRILALSGLPVTAQIATRPGGYQVTWRDVDRQAAVGLLAELSASADAVMWSAVHQVSGAYLSVEDTALRTSGRHLALVGGLVVITFSTAGRLLLSACDVLRDPVTFTQDVGDIATRADVTWQVQGLDEDLNPMTTEATVTVVADDRENPNQGNYGVRRYGLSTQLATQPDAAAVAGAILARTGLGWRLDGVNVTDDDAVTVPVATLLSMLDGTSRNGLAMALTELPDWAPGAPTVAVYLEGGAYHFSGGVWSLDLLVSSATGQGGGLSWDQVNAAWTWDQFSPAVTWDDLVGAAP